MLVAKHKEVQTSASLQSKYKNGTKSLNRA